jgi:hypothetical protein
MKLRRPNDLERVEARRSIVGHRPRTELADQA